MPLPPFRIFRAAEYLLSPTGKQTVLGNRTDLAYSDVKKKQDIPHITRPPNSFMMYRKERNAEICRQYPGANWPLTIMEEPEQVKEFYTQKSEEEKVRHMIKYPEYKYRPKKNKNRSSKTSTESFDGEANLKSSLGWQGSMNSPLNHIQLPSHSDSYISPSPYPPSSGQKRPP